MSLELGAAESARRSVATETTLVRPAMVNSTVQHDIVGAARLAQLFEQGIVDHRAGADQTAPQGGAGLEVTRDGLSR